MNFYLLALRDQVESFCRPLIAADERTARWKPLCVFDAPIQHLMRLFLTSKKNNKNDSPDVSTPQTQQRSLPAWHL